MRILCIDACLCQNLADALQKMTILHSPFATSKTFNFKPILLGKKKNLQTDLTKNMIDVNPKKRLKVA